MTTANVLVNSREARAILKKHPSSIVKGASNPQIFKDPVWYLDQITEAEYCVKGELLICRLPQNQWLQVAVVK